MRLHLVCSHAVARRRHRLADAGRLFRCTITRSAATIEARAAEVVAMVSSRHDVKEGERVWFCSSTALTLDALDLARAVDVNDILRFFQILVFMHRPTFRRFSRNQPFPILCSTQTLNNKTTARVQSAMNVAQMHLFSISAAVQLKELQKRTQGSNEQRRQKKRKESWVIYLMWCV